MSYQAYLLSDHWQRVSEATKLARGYKCELCGISSRDKQLNTHHLTYRHLGCEYSSELIVLCKDCHIAWHDSWRLFHRMKPCWPTILKRLRNAQIKRWDELEYDDNPWSQYEAAKVLFKQWAKNHAQGWRFYDYCIKIAVCYLRLGEES